MNIVAHDMRILVEILGRICAHPSEVKVYWSLANLGRTLPPRNPDDDEPEDEEDDERDDDLDPAVIREPDE